MQQVDGGAGKNGCVRKPRFASFVLAREANADQPIQDALRRNNNGAAIATVRGMPHAIGLITIEEDCVIGVGHNLEFSNPINEHALAR